MIDQWQFEKVPFMCATSGGTALRAAILPTLQGPTSTGHVRARVDNRIDTQSWVQTRVGSCALAGIPAAAMGQDGDDVGSRRVCPAPPLAPPFASEVE